MGEGKTKKSRRGGAGAGEGGSWHLTVKHAFLMRALVLCIPIHRSLPRTEPGRETERDRRGGMRRSRVAAGRKKNEALVER